MNRKQRLQNTLEGKPVDRPAVSFYELNGYSQNPDDEDPYNIYSDPSWQPLLELAKEKTDKIVMCGICKESDKFPPEIQTEQEIWYDENRSRFTKNTIRANDRILTSVTRRDLDVNTIWTTEHLLKNADDLKAWIKLPLTDFCSELNIQKVTDIKQEIGDTGIVLLDTFDPLCVVASMFAMEEYTIIGFTENVLMHQALEKIAEAHYPKVEAMAKAYPGHLWRIYGPEYASPPYLPPYLFEEYVTRYVKPMVDLIHKYGGYARLHSHGMLKDILDFIVATGCDGLDPIEPPPQGDVELAYVREKYGEQLVLFGNLEISDIENLPTDKFSEKVFKAIEQGTQGKSRGFVLMPSASPYGRHLSELTVRNYEKIIEIVENC